MSQFPGYPFTRSHLRAVPADRIDSLSLISLRHVRRRNTRHLHRATSQTAPRFAASRRCIAWISRCTSESSTPSLLRFISVSPLLCMCNGRREFLIPVAFAKRESDARLLSRPIARQSGRHLDYHSCCASLLGNDRLVIDNSGDHRNEGRARTI